MKIHNIKITYPKNCIKISAQCSIRKLTKDVIYYKLNRKYKDYIIVDATPFAASLLLPAMREGENLIIEPPISKQFYKNLKEAMNLMLKWNLDLKPIKIVAKHKVADGHDPSSTAVFFSGGVDSFYSYLKHKSDTKTPLTHFILVNGYDINLKNKKLWRQTSNHVSKIAKHEEIELITVESNFRDLINPILEWDYSFVGALAAVGLLLRGRIKRVYRASSYKRNQIKDATDILIDKFLGTEKFSMIHDGAESSRVEKVNFISKYQVALDELRVCYVNKKGVYNCGKCDKCIRTMVNLKIAGKLSKSKTFPNSLDLELIKNLPITNNHGAIFHQENLRALKKKKIEPDLQKSLEYALTHFKKTRHDQKSLVTKVLYLDHVYARGYVRKVYITLRETASRILCALNSMRAYNFKTYEN